MSTESENQLSQHEIDVKIKSLLSEMHDLLVRSKTNPSVEISKKLVECYLEMESLQKQIKQKMEKIYLED